VHIRDNLNAASRIYTGSYTGDGLTDHGITGVGFTPAYVRIWLRDTTPGNSIVVYETTAEILADDPSGMSIFLDPDELEADDDHIISLDADGFTVDDNANDEHPNKNTTVYNYLCIG